MTTEFCIFNIKTNRYFFRMPEKMVDSYLSVHYSDCKEDKKAPWLMKKSRKVENWK